MDTKILCLGALYLGKASGYDIGKRLDQTFGNFLDIAASGVYPALKSLHKEGLVEFEKIEQLSSPNKKVYELTDAGRERFKSELSTLSPRHKVKSQYILILFFAELLSVNRLDKVISERLKELKFWIAELEKWRYGDEGEHGTLGQKFVVEYSLTVMKAEFEFLNSKSDDLLVALDEETHLTQLSVESSKNQSMQP